MNIILFEEKEISSSVNQSIVITDHRAKHIVKVLRSEPGDTLKVGIINGPKGYAKISDIQKKYPFSVTLQYNFAEGEPEVQSQIDIILALPRPIMLKRILSQATSLGIGSLFLINANRVEKSFWQASILEEKEYREHLVIGLEQAVATRLPQVHIHDKFKIFIEDEFPQIKDEYSNLIVADPRGNKTFSQVLAQPKAESSGSNAPNRTLLAVGPEGGWVDYELGRFREQGFDICTIGERILKVDTAVIALHSRISALTE